MSKTGKGLAEYGRSKLGTPYFYGAKPMNGNLTENFMQVMHNMYPSIVTLAYMALARLKGQVGKVNTDCSGLFAGYRGINNCIKIKRFINCIKRIWPYRLGGITHDKHTD